MRTKGAHVLRETTGTSGIEETLLEAVWRLARHNIPHLVVGGLAVQEHGYSRVTLDADLVVPDVKEAVEFLSGDLSGPFRAYRGCEDTVEDRRNGVLINFLPGGGVLRSGCRVPFPEPRLVTDEPQFVTLEQLIALKLDSWSNSPVRRHKDKTDVIELIQALRLRRDLAIDAGVRSLYEETWDALAAEH